MNAMMGALRGAKGSVKRRLSIEALLVWAIAEQRADFYGRGSATLYPVEAEADGMMVTRRSGDGCARVEAFGRLGTEIDCSPRVVRASGDVHADAEAVYDWLLGLERHDPVAVRVAVDCARAGGARPDWRPGARWRFAPAAYLLRDGQKVARVDRMRQFEALEYYRPRSVPIPLEDRREFDRVRLQNPSGHALMGWVEVVPVVSVDDPDLIDRVRSIYSRWRDVLVLLREQLGGLKEHEVSDVLPLAEPWLDDAEVAAAMMRRGPETLLDFQGYP